MLPREIMEALSKLSSERLQMVLNFLQASSMNQRITRRYNVILEWNEPDEEDPVGVTQYLSPLFPLSLLKAIPKKKLWPTPARQ